MKLVTKTLDQLDGAHIVTRTYHVHLPSQGAAHRPVIFGFHGRGGSGLNFANNPGWSDYADRGYVLVFGDGLDVNGERTWSSLNTPNLNTLRDEDFTLGMRTALIGDHGVDADKMYLCGFSNGADVCWHMYLRHSGLFQGFCTAGRGMGLAFRGLTPTQRRPWATTIGRQDPSWGGHDQEENQALGALETAAEVCRLNNRSVVPVPLAGSPAGRPPNPASGTKLVVYHYPEAVAPSAVVQLGEVVKVTKDAGHRWFAKKRPSYPDNFFMTRSCVEFWKRYAGLPTEL